MSLEIENISSSNRDGVEAIREIRKGITSGNPNIVYLFVSNKYDLTDVGRTIKEEFENITVVGCTTAGEITEECFAEHTMTALVLKSKNYLVKNIFINDLKDLHGLSLEAISNEIGQFKESYKDKKGYKPFSTILIDGLSTLEEQTVGLISTALMDIPLVGGSAGDGLDFNSAYIYHDGEFHQNAACLTLLATDLPFKLFKTQHFTETDKKLVVTEAIPEKRIVTEINGGPAAEAYAEMLNIDPGDFSPMIFSKYPLMLNIGGEYYVRSIQKVTDDGSLTFYCAIDVGLVLTLANRHRMIRNTSNMFEEIKKDVPTLEGCLLFECILRRLEIIDMTVERKERIHKLYRDHNAVGFHTYGEQFGPVHINQTLVGIAFGK